MFGVPLPSPPLLHNVKIPFENENENNNSFIFLKWFLSLPPSSAA